MVSRGVLSFSRLFSLNARFCSRFSSSYGSTCTDERNRRKVDSRIFVVGKRGCTNYALQNLLFCGQFENGRRFFSTMAPVTTHPGSGNVFNLVRRYEDVIGLTDVKDAQNKVLLAERDFQKMQEIRRTKQDQIQDIQTRLKEIHAELDKCSRGEDRYLNLLTQEHAVIKQEKTLMDEFKRLERAERDCFNALSARLRESHEKERERGERTKYWSIIGSAIGALIGILGTTINNRFRMRELRNIVEETSDPGRVQTIVAQLSDMVHNQQQQVSSFVGDLKGMLNNNRAQWGTALTTLAHQQQPSPSADPEQWLSPQQSAAIVSAIKEQDKKMENEMQQIKKMIAAEHGYSMKQDGTIVYVGPEMQMLLDQTEKNLEFKMKMNTLIAVVATYGALAITLPLLYAIFKGG